MSEPKRVAFDLWTLMSLVTVSCLVVAVAYGLPHAGCFLIPAIVGPFVAKLWVRSLRSAILGLLSAYFWTLVLAFPLFFFTPNRIFKSNHVNVSLPIVCFAALGGMLGTKIERGRLEHLARRQRL